MSFLKIKTCTCKNTFQDDRYGQTMRVHSRTKQNKPENERRWRCSVCASEKE